MSTLEYRISKLEALQQPPPESITFEEPLTPAIVDLFNAWRDRAIAVLRFKLGEGPRPPCYDEGMEQFWRKFLEDGTSWSNDPCVLAAHCAMPPIPQIKALALSERSEKLLCAYVIVLCGRFCREREGSNNDARSSPSQA
jgi:hypothetical protein